ncbi:MAG: hypothetical protein AAFR17_09140 [Pseudomonadota bacterium]
MGTPDEDLRLLMTLAVVAGRREVAGEFEPIHRAWQDAYPQDALGPLCRGLDLYRAGQTVEGLDLIEQAAASDTRSAQAREILEDLDQDRAANVDARLGSAA